MATLFDILLNQQLNNNKFYVNKINTNSSVEQSKSIDFIPELDVTETQDSFIIETELPGVNKQDIQIEIKDSKLIIQGEKKRQSNKLKQHNEKSATTTIVVQDKPSIEDEFENDIPTSLNQSELKETEKPKEIESPKEIPSIKKYIQERSFGNFKRYLDLTKILYTLDLSTIKSEFNNGLLTINIAKKQDYSNTIKITL